VTDAAPRLVHGTAVAWGGVAALIRGASGSGKSDLALRCLGLPAGPLTGEVARLVADDQVVVTRDGTGLLVSAPPTIAGRLEVRGVGIIEVGDVKPARLALVVDLVPPAAVSRLPERRWCSLEGVEVPMVVLTPFEASAALKVLLCLRGVSAQNP
jgi:HPr kinase/phosphorylase